MLLAFRVGLFGLLGLIGLAGLVQLPLQPPLTSRSGASSGGVLARLEAQEALLDQRQQASQLLERFVGAQITRYFWGGFSGYLDVLGIEIPTGMKSELKVDESVAQLLLTPRTGSETYLARVEAVESVPRGVVCRGEGRAPLDFPSRAGRLGCPEGWMPLDGRRRRPGVSSSPT